MRDLHQVSNAALGIGTAVLAADNTPAAIDLAGYNGAEIILGIGIGGITFTAVNKIEFVLTHSYDDVTYVAVTDADVLGVTGITTGIIKSLVVAHAAAAVYRFGYIGPRRYLKLLADFSGTHATGTPISATIVRGYPSMAPVPNQA
jgi:hypothetical protein